MADQIVGRVGAARRRNSDAGTADTRRTRIVGDLEHPRVAAHREVTIQVRHWPSRRSQPPSSET